MKIVNDTLKVNGRWAHKRVMAFVSFHSMIIYIFMPIFYPLLDIKEFVVIGFLGYAGACLGIDLNQQKLSKNYTNMPTNTNEPL